MKKIYKLVTIFIIFMAFICNANADDTFSFECVYKSDIGLEVVAKFSNVDQSFLIDAQKASRQSNDYVGSHLSVSYKGTDGKYYILGPKDNAKKNWMGYETAGRNKLHLINNTLSANQRSIYFKQAFLGNGKTTCPTLYIDTLSGFDLYVTPSKYGNGITDPETSVTTLTKTMSPSGPYCFDSATNEIIDCSKVVSNEGTFTEDKLQCDYTSNYCDGTNCVTFRLIYDKNTKKLTFNPSGTELKLTPESGNPNTNEITNSDLLSSFDGKSNCPAQVSCNCRAAALSDKNKTCDFGSNRSPNKNCGTLKTANGQTITDIEEYYSEYEVPGIDLDFDNSSRTCVEILGDNLTKVVHAAITLLRIAGAIIAIVNAMVKLIPAVTSKDADALKKAGKTCVTMAIILAVILLFPTVLRMLGKWLEFDISCIV